MHDLHVWTLTSGVLSMSCHLVMSDDNSSRSAVLARVRGIARERFKIDHTTVQIEDANASANQLDCNCNLGAWHSAR